jgi:hypothetical protein
LAVGGRGSLAADAPEGIDYLKLQYHVARYQTAIGYILRKKILATTRTPAVRRIVLTGSASPTLAWR